MVTSRKIPPRARTPPCVLTAGTCTKPACASGLSLRPSAFCLSVVCRRPWTEILTIARAGVTTRFSRSDSGCVKRIPNRTAIGELNGVALSIPTMRARTGRNYGSSYGRRTPPGLANPRSRGPSRALSSITTGPHAKRMLSPIASACPRHIAIRIEETGRSEPPEASVENDGSASDGREQLIATEAKPV
jgi:hypothetical protein